MDITNTGFFTKLTHPLGTLLLDRTKKSEEIIHNIFFKWISYFGAPKQFLIGLALIYGISTIVGYLMPNLVYSHVLKI